MKKGYEKSGRGGLKKVDSSLIPPKNCQSNGLRRKKEFKRYSTILSMKGFW